MATYIHAKMTTNANKGHRIFGTSRTTKSNRNGGKGHVRQIDSLRSRWRQAPIGATATFTCDQNATIGNVLTVIAADGTTKYFKAASSTSTAGNGNTSGTALEFKHGGSSSGAEVIAAIRVCMVHTNGFGNAGAYFTISAVDGTTITLTQAVLGTVGNTAITSNVVNLSINGAAEATSTTFTGGADGFKTAERLFEPGLNYGASLGTTYEGSTIGRTNTSAGDKDLIRDSAA